MKPQTALTHKPIVSALITALFGISLTSVQAAPLSISQTPLLVSTTVQPNVMLLIDDSGSMDHIMWHDSYNPATAYAGGYATNTTYAISAAGWYTLNGNNYRLPNPASTDNHTLPNATTHVHNTRYLGNYLNWISTFFPAGSDLTTGLIPNSTRIQTARSATTNFVNNTSGMRFGLSSFNLDSGGTIDAECGAATSTVTTSINDLRAENWTPLSESLYEVTRYFRGLNSSYGSTIPGGGTNYTSPIQYRCQKNFAIVVTDGLPTFDTTFPTDDPADTLDTTAALPNWDNLAPATPVTLPQVYPPYSDGHTNGTESTEGFSLFLDDIAKFAYNIDMKTTGNDSSGGSYEDPAFLKQNLNTYTIGFTVANQMLQDAAQYGNGLYLQANTATQLTTALQSAINHVFSTSSSSSSVASNSTRLNTETKIYQAKFNSLQWSGELLASPLNSDGSVGSSTSNAANNMPAPNDRTIYTYKPGSTPAGVPFTWTGGGLPGTTSLSASQQTALNTNISATVDNLGIQRVAYLRGDRSLEVQNGGTFRNRASTTGGSPLGDIVNSDPHFVGTPDYRYHLLPGTEGTSYRTFRDSSSYKNRPPMLYVGANDGMLHAFNANSLTESFAFIPNAVFANLSALTATNYGHKFYVDGSPKSGDAYIGGGWKTVLVSGLRAGGKSVFALDVTNPSGFSANNVLWEFTDATNLGYTYSQPTIVRLKNGSWAAIFGNGYNSTAQTAQLFVVNLSTGALIERIDTGVGNATTPNGLSTPAPVDVDGDRITDYVYAGDLYGNMWKFDLNHTNSTQWKLDYKLYQAVDGSGNNQPITVRPEIGTYSYTTTGPSGTSISNGTMVYFGTGKYFETGDNSISGTPQVQTFYGIRDNGSAVSGGRTSLQEQTILTEQPLNGKLWRTVSNTDVENSKYGWYLNLISPVSGVQGERNVSNPLLRDGRIIFTTLIPDPDACSFGGRSWIMELDGQTGQRLTYPVFDLNGDGVVDSNDLLPDGTPPSGESLDGIVPAPNIVGAGEVEYKYMSSSTGRVETITERGDSRAARQSWRQIR